MTTILTPADIVRKTGWTMQRVQRLCKSGKLPVKNISMGPKNGRYIIEESVFDNWIKSSTVVQAQQNVTRRTRLDSQVQNKVL